jgi:[ribosomal protein S18]-alanine N-acetyltransferase
VTSFRPATDADVDAVAALEADIFGADAWSPASVREEVTAASRQCFVAVEDGEIRGYVVVRDAGDVADLQRIAVAPAMRRRGLAAQLLRRCDVSAYDRTLLEVRADNVAAIAFYRREGFSEIARRRTYYADGTDAVVMQR